MAAAMDPPERPSSTPLPEQTAPPAGAKRATRSKTGGEENDPPSPSDRYSSDLQEWQDTPGPSTRGSTPRMSGEWPEDLNVHRHIASGEFAVSTPRSRNAPRSPLAWSSPPPSGPSAAPLPPHQDVFSATWCAEEVVLKVLKIKFISSSSAKSDFENETVGSGRFPRCRPSAPRRPGSRL